MPPEENRGQTPAPPPPPAPPLPPGEPAPPAPPAEATPPTEPTTHELSGTIEVPVNADVPPAVDEAQVAVAPVQPVAPSKVLPPEWPYKGFQGTQPWEADNPPAITHDQRMLSSGTAGPAVAELGALLADVGIPTSISEGGNPHAIYDAQMGAAVRRFCAEYGVSEDPAIVAAMTPDVVGPWIWEALIRAARKAAS
jgi:hypothetical protein